MPGEDRPPQPEGPAGPPASAPPTVGGADRVDRTGIALVHEGEYILPAAGSQAVLSPMGDAGPVMNYYFPIEVEVVGDVDQALVDRVVGTVFAELDRELASRQ